MAPAFAVDFRTGLGAQSRPYRQVLVAESGSDVSDFLSPSPPDQASRVIEAKPGVTGVALRQLLFDHIADLDGDDIVVMADCDDRLRPGALEAFEAGLRTADVTAADMAIMDGDGLCTGAHFFAGADIPDDVFDPAALTDKNWFGMSNTAMRAVVFADGAPQIPETIQAVDWWLYHQILAQGFQAQRLDCVVTDYRSTPRSTLGYGPARSLETLARRVNIVTQHQRAVAGTASGAIEGLVARMADDPVGLEADLRKLPETGVWYEDVFRLAGGA